MGSGTGLAGEDDDDPLLRPTWEETEDETDELGLALWMIETVGSFTDQFDVPPSNPEATRRQHSPRIQNISRQQTLFFQVVFSGLKEG